MIGPEDIGHRVVIRRFVGVRDGRPTYTDVLGVLRDFGDTARVAADRGEVLVPVAEIAAAKRIPPRRTPAGTQIAALERIASAAWPATHTAHLGDWQLRAAGGWTGRANSVLPLGDPGLPLDEALVEVAAWYAGFGLPARINVPLPLRTNLDRALTERGWSRSARTLVQARPLAGLDPGSSATPARDDGSSDAVALDGEPSAEWLRMMAGVKGELPAVARGILTGPELLRFAGITDDTGALVAIGRGAVNEGYLQLSLIQVLPAARGRGLARQVIRALAGWAAETGAQHAYLQVEEVNTAATTLYASLGFTTHHSYFTRTAPALTPGPEKRPGPEQQTSC